MRITETRSVVSASTISSDLHHGLYAVEIDDTSRISELLFKKLDCREFPTFTTSRLSGIDVAMIGNVGRR